MIDEQLINSAKEIRKKFLNLTKDLDFYQSEVGKLISFLQEKMKYFEDFNNKSVKNIKNKTDIGDVTNELLKRIEEIEVEELKMQKKIKIINDQLEKLRSDEELLYKTIKQRYPELTDQQIIKEIQSKLN